MRKTTLLVFDNQLLGILGSLKKLHSCFSIIFVQSLPSSKAKAILELRKEGWKIDTIPFSYEKAFVKRVKAQLRKNHIQNVVFLQPQESFQKKMKNLLKKELKICVKTKFEDLILEACLYFERFMKKRLKKHNELSFQQINRKFSLLIDEYEELIVEGLTDKRLDVPKELARLKSPVTFLGQGSSKFIEKINIPFEEEKEV